MHAGITNHLIVACFAVKGKSLDVLFSCVGFLGNGSIHYASER